MTAATVIYDFNICIVRICATDSVRYNLMNYDNDIKDDI